MHDAAALREKAIDPAGDSSGEGSRAATYVGDVKGLRHPAKARRRRLLTLTGSVPTRSCARPENPRPVSGRWQERVMQEDFEGLLVTKRGPSELREVALEFV
jgi:hypothetical protein